MAGINLSQSLQEKEAEVRGTFFDTGLYISLGVLALILMVFGGGRLYLSSLNQKLAGLEAEITARKSELHGSAVDRVADFRVRLDMIETALKGSPMHQDLFATLENKIVANTRLTLYQENWSEGVVVIAGVTDSMKFVAQEMLVLKSIPRVQKVVAESLDYNDEGQLEFTLVLSVSKANEKITTL